MNIAGGGLVQGNTSDGLEPSHDAHTSVLSPYRRATSCSEVYVALFTIAYISSSLFRLIAAMGTSMLTSNSEFNRSTLPIFTCFQSLPNFRIRCTHPKGASLRKSLSRILGSSSSPTRTMAIPIREIEPRTKLTAPISRCLLPASNSICSFYYSATYLDPTALRSVELAPTIRCQVTAMPYDLLAPKDMQKRKP